MIWIIKKAITESKVPEMGPVSLGGNMSLSAVGAYLETFQYAQGQNQAQSGLNQLNHSSSCLLIAQVTPLRFSCPRTEVEFV